jgi:glycosyltransferase involved in cell wall biosynthesis
MMRIGLVTGEYPPDQGGVGAFTQELAEPFVELGHEPHVITNVGQALGAQSEAPNVVVHRAIDNWGWRCWRRILALADGLHLDVLNVQYQAAAYRMHPAINILPRRQGRPPIAVTFHDLKAPYLFPKAGPLRWQVVRLLARRADGVIVTNREDFMRLENEIPTKRLNLIPIGSNIPAAPPSEYDRDAERARWGIEPKDVLLGYFGFLNESKGGEELMRALAFLVERGMPAHLLMVGGRLGSSDPTNQAYAERVDALITSLDLEERVHWSGYSHSERVSAALLATDVCVLPYRDGVSFRRGTLHACLAHGRAIVTTHPAVPLPQVQDWENMLLVEPQNPRKLADAVMRVATDLALRKRLEAGAAALAAEYSWERIARQTAAFFGRL